MLGFYSHTPGKREGVLTSEGRNEVSVTGKHSGSCKWSGTPANEGYQRDFWQRHKEILGFPICEECELALDRVVVDRELTDEYIEDELQRVRREILETTKHGHHHFRGMYGPRQVPEG